jgi:hypothetical protein
MLHFSATIDTNCPTIGENFTSVICHVKAEQWEQARLLTVDGSLVVMALGDFEKLIAAKFCSYTASLTAEFPHAGVGLIE